MSKDTAISHWPDSGAIYQDVARLISLPVYMPNKGAMDKYGRYFKERCRKSAAAFESSFNRL